MAMSLRWVLDARLGTGLVDLVSFPFGVHRPHLVLRALDVPGFLDQWAEVVFQSGHLV